MNTDKYLAQRRFEIANNIRRFRRFNGWTQEQMAEYLNCSLSRIARVEKAHAELTVGELELLAEAFNVRLFHLLSYPEEEYLEKKIMEIITALGKDN